MSGDEIFEALISNINNEMNSQQTYSEHDIERFINMFAAAIAIIAELFETQRNASVQKLETVWALIMEFDHATWSNILESTWYEEQLNEDVTANILRQTVTCRLCGIILDEIDLGNLTEEVLPSFDGNSIMQTALSIYMEKVCETDVKKRNQIAHLINSAMLLSH